MRAGWKLSRSYGTANGLVVHRISDLGAVGAAGSEAVGLAKGLLARTWCSPMPRRLAARLSTARSVEDSLSTSRSRSMTQPGKSSSSGSPQ